MTHTITVEGINPDGTTLVLSDNGDTIASRGDKVQWIIGPESGVVSITGIEDNSHIDVFDPDPANTDGVWSGLINPNLDLTGGPCEELYTIKFTTVSNDEERSFDPKIQVDS